MVKVKESAALAAYNAKAVPEGFERIRIARTRGPILRFNGKLFCEYEMSSKAHQDRWMTLAVYETPGGAWIVHKAANSDAPGERDFHDAWVIEAPVPMESRPTLVMEALDWSLPARNMAKQQGWRFEEFVE
jgi:hypothetical protein